jgi:tetratricopeptide (TPR) repeat protein
MSKKTKKSPADEQHTNALQKPFLNALKLRRKGDLNKATKLLHEVLAGDPRLPEPHLELAHIHLEAERFDEAEEQAREGLKWLMQGGQWVKDLDPKVVLSHAHDLLGQILQDRAATDEVVFGDEDLFKDLIKEARRHFVTARDLDPKNEHANFNAFFMDFESEPSADNPSADKPSE